MGFYIRKRARILPGIWLNLGKNGLSVSAGFGSFRYRQMLINGKKRQQEPYEQTPEPTTAQYVGCGIYSVGLVILVIGICAGFFMTGFYIFLVCLVIGSLFTIIGRDSTQDIKTIKVTDEASLNKAIANLNAIVSLMEADTEATTLSKHYQYARLQLKELPQSLELNHQSKQDAENTILCLYADKLKTLKK